MAPVGCHTRWPYAGIHTLYTPFCTMGTRQHPDGGHGGRGCCTHAWYTRRCCCWADARGGSSRQRRRSGGAPADAPPAEGSGHDRPHAGCAATVRQSPRQLNRGFRAVVGPRGRHAFSSSSTSPRRHSHVFGLRAARATLKPLCTLMSATAVQRTELATGCMLAVQGAGAGAGAHRTFRSAPPPHPPPCTEPANMQGQDSSAAAASAAVSRQRATAEQYSQDSGTIMYIKVYFRRPLQVLSWLPPGQTSRCEYD
jgi:hypothetical protein